jgi:hypothetical protein
MILRAKMQPKEIKARPPKCPIFPLERREALLDKKTVSTPFLYQQETILTPAI